MGKSRRLKIQHFTIISCKIFHILKLHKFVKSKKKCFRCMQPRCSITTLSNSAPSKLNIFLITRPLSSLFEDYACTPYWYLYYNWAFKNNKTKIWILVLTTKTLFTFHDLLFMYIKTYTVINSYESHLENSLGTKNEKNKISSIIKGNQMALSSKLHLWLGVTPN